MRLYEYTAAQLSRMMQDGECSAVEIVRDLQQRIAETEPKIGAYLAFDSSAIDQARIIDKQRAGRKKLHPLAGIPICVKDNISTCGLRTTCASRMLENYIPPYDAAVMERVHNAGLILLGKTNMDEFAMGSSTENSHMQITRNPCHTSYVPGGSSGGSAAAVSTGSAVLALGSDTGGSVRQPASFCGCVGIKPTYGTVSRYGLIAYASSFDQIGPITRDVTDAAMLLQLLQGHDPRDATTVKRKYPDLLSYLKQDIRGLRIGVPKEYFISVIDDSVKKPLLNALATLESCGAVLKEISLPYLTHAVSTYYILASAEAASNLARYDGIRYGYRTSSKYDLKEMYARSRSEGFGKEVKRRIMLGTMVLSAQSHAAYYKKADAMRRKITAMLSDAFDDVDLIASPTATTPAFRFGTRELNDMYSSDFCTVAANLSGLPAISVPCGCSPEGLPIGLQLMGPAFSEPLLLQAAYTYEQKGGVCRYARI